MRTLQAIGHRAGRPVHCGFEVCRAIRLRRTILVVALLVLTIAGCALRTDSPTEIALLGGNHLAYLYDPDYSPTHLRALLTKLNPQAIAIENLPEWQAAGKRFWTFLPEYCVTDSYASAKGIPVFGVDSDSLSDHDGTCVGLRNHWKTTNVPARRTQMDETARSIGDWQAGLLFRERPGGIDAAYKQLEEEGSDPDQVRRDDRIAENIVKTARQFPRKRVAVILGAYHLTPQARRLGQQPGVRVLDVKRFLPLRKEEIEAAWQKTDYHLVLGASLDSYLVPAIQHMRNHQRSRDLLDRLKTLDSVSALARYYEARWNLIFGRNEKAKALLQSIISVQSTEHFPCHPCSEWSWPPWPGIHEKALFTLATILDGEQDRVGAVAIYRDLLAKLPARQLRPRFRGPGTYYDLRWYLESLIREPYRGGVQEAFRAKEAQRCWLAAEIPDDAWPD